MLEIHFSTTLIICITVTVFVFILTQVKKSVSSSSKHPKSYPIVGSFFSILKNNVRFVQWTSEMVNSTPTLTLTLHRTFGRRAIYTANPANVQYILKTNFNNYQKGYFFRTNMKDLLGDGILNSDGDNWRFQRQVASHEFNAKSLRKFIETVVDSEISDRLIPTLRAAAAENTVIDLLDVFHRLAFDNICKIAFGHDPEYLSQSLSPQQDKFVKAFETAITLTSKRLEPFIPYFWKIKRALNIGSEKQLRIAINEVRGFAKELIKKKKQVISSMESVEGDDLLSRFLNSGHFDEDFVTDEIINFILAGKDSTSVVLTWFFWLLSKNPDVEDKILAEVEEKSELASSGYDEVKEMAYIHASIYETMRFYPAVPIDSKEVVSDDVLPDGTKVYKGMRVGYHIYAMGRVEKVWGKDWAEFRPSRWLEKAADGGDKWRFVNKDPYVYPVFQAGTRVCIGKEMALLQMKRVIAAVVRQFKVAPLVAEPVYTKGITATMKGGLPVRIQEKI